jgi:hypothetical protein
LLLTGGLIYLPSLPTPRDGGSTPPPFRPFLPVNSFRLPPAGEPRYVRHTGLTQRDREGASVGRRFVDLALGRRQSARPDSSADRVHVRSFAVGGMLRIKLGQSVPPRNAHSARWPCPELPVKPPYRLVPGTADGVARLRIKLRQSVPPRNGHSARGLVPSCWFRCASKPNNAFIPPSSSDASV